MIKRIRRTAGLVMLLAGTGLAIPESAARVVVIRNATYHTITRGIMRGGNLVIRDGRISALGFDGAAGPEARIIEAEGLHVLPGLIDGFTNLGAGDIETQNRDFDEATEPLTPHLRIIDSIHLENRFIPAARETGITSILCAPGESNLLSGQSALIRLYGESVDQAVMRFPAAIHGSLGERPKLRYGPKNRAPMTRMGSAAMLRRILTEARAYIERRGRENPPPRDLKMEAMGRLLKGEAPLVLRAQRRDDILTALRIADEFDLRLVINHGVEAYRVAERLAESGIPVIVGPIFENRMRQETARAVLENPARLHRAGVKIAFQTGSFRHFGDLIYQARIAIRHGLPEDAALRAMTLSPAEIFGAADRLGSLDPGKDADLVVFDGNPLDEGSRPVLIIIAGRLVEPKA